MTRPDGDSPIVEHVLGVLVERTVYTRPDAPLAEGVERLEEVVAGGDSDAVGYWSWTLSLENGEWFSKIECFYGVGGVVKLGGEFDGVMLPGPIDFDVVDTPLGPFGSREEATSAVATRLLACVAVLSGQWEPSNLG